MEKELLNPVVAWSKKDRLSHPQCVFSLSRSMKEINITQSQSKERYAYERPPTMVESANRHERVTKKIEKVYTPIRHHSVDKKSMEHRAMVTFAAAPSRFVVQENQDLKAVVTNENVQVNV